MRLSTVLHFGLLALLTGFCAAPALAFGIGLQPTTVEMTVEPGERQRQVINIGNVHTEKTISLTIGLADWTLDKKGQIQLAPPGEREDSASEWVRFSPAYITLKPGESEQIIVDMSAPMRVERDGDFRFAVIASTILPESRSGQSGVWRKYQIASLFYLTMGNAESSPQITGAGLTLADDGTQALDLSVENSGSAHARLRGEVEVTGDSGQTIKLPITNLVVLHKGKRDLTLPINGELPANPRVKVNLENAFAPQSSSGVLALPTYTAPLALKQAAQEGLDAIDGETSLE